MNKYEANKQMLLGKKVAHRYFSDDEWMTMDGFKYVFEDGVRCDFDRFWETRTGEHWENGWFVWEG